tara:strand:+ start:1001 stop:2146 length:1146 start_codon:yes stop_codon:yes gene_type:complete
MKTTAYWSPFLTNVATINAVINSAKSLRLYSKNYRPIIINACGEFTPFKSNLEKNGIELKNIINFDYHKFLPKQGFLKSRFSYIVIFFISIIPLIIFLKKEKPDYFICHLITSLPILISKIINQKTKFILRISGLININLLRKYFWIFIGHKIFLVTCPTISTLNHIKNKNIFYKDKIVLLRDPVINIRKINKKKKERLSYNIDKKNYNIVCVGRLTKQKNFKLIINSFDQILKIKKNCKLIIIGEGEEKYYLQDLIDKKNLSKNITLVGFEKNIFKFLSNSNLFILSSLWEDPGWVLIEAAISDILILSSNCKNGPSEFIQDNKGGILFQNNSTSDLVNKFREINNLDKKQILAKKLFAKKKANEFTIFNHFLHFERILN